MKKLVALITILIMGILAVAESYYAAQFMALSAAEKKWGTQSLDAKTFSEGNLSKRAPMAVDILKRSLYVGKS